MLKEAIVQLVYLGYANIRLEIKTMQQIFFFSLGVGWGECPFRFLCLIHYVWTCCGVWMFSTCWSVSKVCTCFLLGPKPDGLWWWWWWWGAGGGDGGGDSLCRSLTTSLRCWSCLSIFIPMLDTSFLCLLLSAMVEVFAF